MKCRICYAAGGYLAGYEHVFQNYNLEKVLVYPKEPDGYEYYITINSLEEFRTFIIKLNERIVFEVDKEGNNLITIYDSEIE